MFEDDKYCEEYDQECHEECECAEEYPLTHEYGPTPDYLSEYGPHPVQTECLIEEHTCRHGSQFNMVRIKTDLHGAIMEILCDDYQKGLCDLLQTNPTECRVSIRPAEYYYG
jgi:hypothetical protein